MTDEQQVKEGSKQRGSAAAAGQNVPLCSDLAATPRAAASPHLVLPNTTLTTVHHEMHTWDHDSVRYVLNGSV